MLKKLLIGDQKLILELDYKFKDLTIKELSILKIGNKDLGHLLKKENLIIKDNDSELNFFILLFLFENYYFFLLNL
jgi:hypothetical protein